MKGQARSVMIGVFAIAAILLLVWLVLFLHPKVGDGEQIIRVRFSDVEKVNIGTRVLFAGKPVGQVIEINEIYEAREQPQPDELSRQIYFYELVLAVDSSVQVYDTDEIVLETTGLFGERVINIIPRKPPPGVTPVPITRQVIYAQTGEQMQDLIARLGVVAENMSQTFARINELLADDGKMTAAIESFDAFLEEARITMNDINESDMVDAFKVAADKFGDAMGTLDETLLALEDDGFWEATKEAFDGIGDLAEQVTNGEGTIGRLIQEDDLYLQTLDLLAKGNTFLNDVNHYGILFQFNKGWQRKRTQRANQIQNLRSPAAFGRYFNCEVDQIRTALARIQMMVDRAECECNLNCSGCFNAELETLLNQVRQLEKRIDAYNAQLTACHE